MDVSKAVKAPLTHLHITIYAETRRVPGKIFDLGEVVAGGHERRIKHTWICHQLQ
jgi:hypothetical protein